MDNLIIDMITKASSFCEGIAGFCDEKNARATRMASSLAISNLLPSMDPLRSMIKIRLDLTCDCTLLKYSFFKRKLKVNTPCVTPVSLVGSSFI